MELLPSLRKPDSKSRLVYKMSGYNRPYVLLILPLMVAVGVFSFVNNRFPGFQLSFLVVDGAALIIIIILYFKFIHKNVFNAQWFLILGEKRVYINACSRLRPVSKKQILCFYPHEIKHIQQSRRTVHAQGALSSEQRTLHFKFLDITFYDNVADSLLQNVATECQEITNDHKDNVSEVMKSLQNSQVTLRNPKTIRIRMDNVSLDILNAIIYFQKQQVRIVEDRCEEMFYQAEEHRHMEKILAELAINDDTSAAARLAQKVYCLDEGEAKQVIVQLKNSVAN